MRLFLYCIELTEFRQIADAYVRKIGTMIIIVMIWIVDCEFLFRNDLTEMVRYKLDHVI